MRPMPSTYSFPHSIATGRSPMPSTATTRILYTSNAASRSARDRGWAWPLCSVDGIAPQIYAANKVSSDRGVELSYPRDVSLPDSLPVVATHDGIIAYARTVPSTALSLDHAEGWSTHYDGLAQIDMLPTDRFRGRRRIRVRRGEVLGHILGTSPRIRFALSRLSDDGSSDVDAAHTMRTWLLLPWTSRTAARSVRE